MTLLRRLLVTLAVLAGLATGHTYADENFLSNGVKINYSVKGKGEPIILIHAAGFPAAGSTGTCPARPGCWPGTTR
jgi:hypothetical protein